MDNVEGCDHEIDKKNINEITVDDEGIDDWYARSSQATQNFHVAVKSLPKKRRRKMPERYGD